MNRRMKKFWLARQPRERRLMLSGIGIVLLPLLWLSVQAAGRYQLNAQQQACQSLTSLANMRQQVVALEPLLMRQQRQQSPRWQEEVLALAADKGLALEVSGRDAAQLLFSPTPADITRLSQWLQQLEQEYRVSATQLRLSSGPDGVTLVQLVLRRHE